MKQRTSVVAVLFVGLFSTACSKPAAITDCVAKGNAQPLCIFQNPEDFVLLTDDRSLIVSQMGSPDASKPGSLVFFDIPSKWVMLAFAGEYSTHARVHEGWGDPSCPGPPGAAFAPHGLSLGQRLDGKLQLLVVNHGGRESIEFFELDDVSQPPILGWRGCAVIPDDSTMNDVAMLPDGGFVATRMFPKRGSMLYALAAMAGFSTGYVLEWEPGQGFRKVAGSDGRMPNGIEVGPDGDALYIDMYFGGEVRKISRRTGATLATGKVEHADNVMWSPDGSLLVASHNTSVANVMACNRIEKGACPARFSILQLNPDTLATTVVYENEGPPMGAGTTALRIGNDLFIGTFSGDRMLRVNLAAKTPST